MCPPPGTCWILPMPRGSSRRTGSDRRVTKARWGDNHAMVTRRQTPRARYHSKMLNTSATAEWVASTSPVTRAVTAPVPIACREVTSHRRMAAKTRRWRRPNTRLNVPVYVTSQANSVTALRW